MQKLRRVKLTVEAYVQEQFHKRMRPPEQCPNCGRFHRLWAHGVLRSLDSTESTGKALRFLVRRFLCTFCGITVSCLPCFAQPYRLVNHTTLEAFLKGQNGRRDVQAQAGAADSATCGVLPSGGPACCGSSAIASAAPRRKKKPPPSGEERWRCAGQPRNSPCNWSKSSAPPASGPTAATSPPSHSRRGSARRPTVRSRTPHNRYFYIRAGSLTSCAA